MPHGRPPCRHPSRPAVHSIPRFRTTRPSGTCAASTVLAFAPSRALPHRGRQGLRSTAWDGAGMAKGKPVDEMGPAGTGDKLLRHEQASRCASDSNKGLATSARRAAGAVRTTRNGDRGTWGEPRNDRNGRGKPTLESPNMPPHTRLAISSRRRGRPTVAGTSSAVELRISIEPRPLGPVNCLRGS